MFGNWAQPLPMYRSPPVCLVETVPSGDVPKNNKRRLFSSGVITKLRFTVSFHRLDSRHRAERRATTPRVSRTGYGPARHFSSPARHVRVKWCPHVGMNCAPVIRHHLNTIISGHAAMCFQSARKTEFVGTQ